MSNNTAALRCLLAGLREAVFVTSAKGHGGSWMMAEDHLQRARQMLKKKM